MYKKNAFAFATVIFCYYIYTAPQKEDADPLQSKSDHTSAVKQKINPRESSTKLSLDEKKSAASAKRRTIKVKNEITPEMIKYRFWGTYYSPTNFYLTIGNTRLKEGDCVECSVNEKNQIEVIYHYEFKNGMVTGSKCIEFFIPENESTIAITFSWEKKHRLVSNCGHSVTAKHGVLKSSCSFT